MFEFEPVTYEFEEVSEVDAEFFSVGLALLNVPVGDGVSDEESSWVTVPVAGWCSFFLSLKMFLKAIVVVLGGGGSNKGEDCG